MAYYIALLHRAESGGYGVSLPDFPGCISFGDSVEEALTNAAEALSLHTSDEPVEALPAARTLEEIAADPDWADSMDGALIAQLPYWREHGKARPMNVTFDAGLRAQIQEAAKRRGMSNSALLALAARKEISAAG